MAMLQRGMVCCTDFGTGTVQSIDHDNNKVRLKDLMDGHEFTVAQEEIMTSAYPEDPQLHNGCEKYY